MSKQSNQRYRKEMKGLDEPTHSSAEKEPAKKADVTGNASNSAKSKDKL